MKTRIYLFAAVFAAAALFNGCAKDGATGPAGPAGASGTNGTNGNANVIMAVFGSQSLSVATSSISLTLPAPITANMIDSSLVLVYHQNSICGTNWYASNGLGCGADYTTRFYLSNTILVLQIHNSNGTAYSGTNQTFTKVKVIVAPSRIYTGSRLAVDFNDYYAVIKYFNLEDI